MTVMEIVIRTRGAARRFASDCSAATAIEYALMAALIGGAVVVGVSALGESVAALYGRVVAAFTG